MEERFMADEKTSDKKEPAADPPEQPKRA